MGTRKQNPFMQFMKTFRKQNKGKYDFKQMGKEAGKAWHGMNKTMRAKKGRGMKIWGGADGESAEQIKDAIIEQVEKLFAMVGEKKDDTIASDEEGAPGTPVADEEDEKKDESAGTPVADEEDEKKDESAGTPEEDEKKDEEKGESAGTPEEDEKKDEEKGESGYGAADKGTYGGRRRRKRRGGSLSYAEYTAGGNNSKKKHRR